ncbi:MAG TPA: hypothetical protein EYG03_14650 [Planctomycetes bacterium]|nr:hypothetical protein [Fuerstiella sp.]HIK93199.1 hypothetical protein [Planctomycetota bacterium]
MQHADFLNDSDSGRYDWRLTNWSATVRVVLGGRALVLFRAAFAILFTPAVLLAVYSLYTNRPVLLILVLLSFWSFRSSSTRPTGIGIATSMFTAIAIFVFSVIIQNTLLALFCVLPGATWLGSCVILGTTAQYLTEALRGSEALFQTLLDSDIMKAVDLAER